MIRLLDAGKNLMEIEKVCSKIKSNPIGLNIYYFIKMRIIISESCDTSTTVWTIDFYNNNLNSIIL